MANYTQREKEVIAELQKHTDAIEKIIREANKEGVECAAILFTGVINSQEGDSINATDISVGSGVAAALLTYTQSYAQLERLADEVKEF